MDAENTRIKNIIKNVMAEFHYDKVIKDSAYDRNTIIDLLIPWVSLILIDLGESDPDRLINPYIPFINEEFDRNITNYGENC